MIDMIHVIANIVLMPGRRDDFLIEFRKVVPLVLAEAGCLEYGPTIDIPTGLGLQEPVRDEGVTVVEKWESLDHLRAHLTALHMGVYREAVQGMMISTRLLVLEPA